MGYSWLTIHRVRFAEPRSAKEHGPPPGPPRAASWRFGPHAPLGPDGLRTGVSREWGGIGFYDSREAAEAVIADPPANLSFLDETDEDWHTLAGVISDRGFRNWATPADPTPELKPLDADPGGRLGVITSAGYEPRPDGSLDPRVKPFLAKINNVVEYYGTLDENLARCLFNAAGWAFGMTFSIWKSDRGMMASAYRSGTHSDYLHEHLGQPMFDYSSFTRVRLLDSAGTWDGVDPAKAA